MGFLPPNDLASFLENPAPEVRAAALLSLNVKKALPADLQQAVLDRLDDRSVEVRQAAMLAVVPLRVLRSHSAVVGHRRGSRAPRTAPLAMEALCGLPDPRAVSVYLAAIQDRNPRLRRAGESALLAIRDKATDELVSAAQKGTLSGPAALSLDRVLARFDPIRDWRVIGPFPRTAPQVFVGRPSIDFARAHTGAEGRSVAWALAPGRPVERPRRPGRPQERRGRPRRLRLRPEQLARPLRLRLCRSRGRPRWARLDAARIQWNDDRDRQRTARLSVQQPCRQGLLTRQRHRAAQPGQGKEPNPGRQPAGDRALVLRSSSREALAQVEWTEPHSGLRR